MKRLKINTPACKQAIVDFLRQNPGLVQAQFCDPVDESLSLNVKNWRRIYKSKPSWAPKVPGPFQPKWQRGFECKAYGDGDELRAYTWDDEQTILAVEVLGE